MPYGNKVKFHYDVPAYIKKQLAEAAKKLNMTATELLSKTIEEEYERVKREQTSANSGK
ncbi:hypothetical protein [Paenibacillus sp. SSG-1]|uniref:hypothetical protein n=1 Tax=Paenibacillus sp. SSG-1 TaxID=1443669 RepID=UPI0015C68D8F|nr:hypothetical protein [Paenibacillus sp. SSG-1]